MPAATRIEEHALAVAEREPARDHPLEREDDDHFDRQREEHQPVRPGRSTA